MVSLEQLDKMKYAEIGEGASSPLVDIRDVCIEGQTYEKRLCSFLSQVVNPYCYKVGDTPVRISFLPEGKPLEEKLKTYFLFIKQNTFGAQIKE